MNNDKIIIRQNVRHLVAKNKLGEAVDYLWKYAEQDDEESLDDIVVLKRNITDVENECLLGKIGLEKACKMKNQLAERILIMAKNLFAAIEEAY